MRVDTEICVVPMAVCADGELCMEHLLALQETVNTFSRIPGAVFEAAIARMEKRKRAEPKDEKACVAAIATLREARASSERIHAILTANQGVFREAMARAAVERATTVFTS